MWFQWKYSGLKPVCRSHRNPDVGHVTGSDLLLTEEREEGVMMVMVVVIGG